MALPIGLTLTAVALLTGAAPAAFWLHALTIGAAATMTLAVMTRASLGHTGRPLIVDPVIALAYLLLTAAALVRIFGLAILRIPYPEVILVAAFLWTAAFILFTWIYAPMLLALRADGKPGCSCSYIRCYVERYHSFSSPERRAACFLPHCSLVSSSPRRMPL